MTKTLTKLWNLFRQSMRGIDSNRQLALGIMFGMIIGLIPKDSLFCYGFMIVMMLTTADLLSAIVAGFFFTWIGYVATPLTDQLGLWALTFQPLKSIWVQLEGLPLMKWTRFENTVVMGSLLLAVICAWPVYHYCLRLFQTHGSAFYNHIGKSRLRYLIAMPDTNAPSKVTEESTEFAGSEFVGSENLV